MYNTPSLEFPSIYVLLGLIGGYVLLVGPVNYLALRRLRRPGLTWLTVPVLAPPVLRHRLLPGCGGQGEETSKGAPSASSKRRRTQTGRGSGVWWES